MKNNLQHDKKAIIVEFVTRSQILQEKLKVFGNGSNLIGTVIFEVPVKNDAIDVYILPQKEISFLDSFDDKERTPVIFYGKGQFLKKSFLSGCSDYLKEPWDFDELEARILKAAKSRSIHTIVGIIKLQPYMIKFKNRSVSLTKHQYSILTLLAKYQGDIITKEAIHYYAWNKKEVIEKENSRMIDMTVSRLRKKIHLLLNEDIEVIHSVYGQGFTI